jgi:endosialidase-like protein
MNLRTGVRVVVLLILLPLIGMAQLQRDSVPLKPWPAPLFWQPTEAENRAASEQPYMAADQINATTPPNSLVFVGMTPCRVADTRTGSGFTGAFGPPSLVGGGSRTFPIQSSMTCAIPSIAQAYSFNITLVPLGFVDYITVWPTGQVRPNASTLNGYVNTVIANAAIVPAGTMGSVDVFASQAADIIIDINGYYAPQTGITLAGGTNAAPSLSFASDPSTGIYSGGPGHMGFTSGGITRMTINAMGDVLMGANATAALTLSGNTVNSQTQYNLQGSRILGTSPFSLYAGLSAGTLSTGAENAFFGYTAGTNTTTGGENSFFGSGAGSSNQTGVYNSFFGSESGFSSTGTGNSFFGRRAGQNVTSGTANSIFGESAGTNLTTGSSNTFIGRNTGPAAAQPNIANATAIGANARVTQNNSLVLGGITGINGGTDTSVGIGTTAPTTTLDVTNSDSQIRFGDTAADSGGYLTSTEASQAIISGGAKWNGSAWVAKNSSASLLEQAAGAINFFSNSGMAVGATFTPTERFGVSPTGIVTITGLAGSGTTPLCRNASNQISTCPSSIRYKTNLNDFNSGMNLIRRLHPVSFDWKESGTPDFGLVAEDVEKVEPLLVTRNDQGEVEGVKYDRIGVVLVNALQEQQRQIESQQNQINEQKELIETLKRLVCMQNSGVELCR